MNVLTPHDEYALFRAPPGFVNNAANRSNTDFTHLTGTCMIVS